MSVPDPKADMTLADSLTGPAGCYSLGWLSIGKYRNNSGRERQWRQHTKASVFAEPFRWEVSGEPEAMGYCHCRSCRSWSGGPVNAFTLWKPDAVRVTAGKEHVAMFQKTEVSQRQYCRKCAGHVMANHPPLGLVDVFAATLPTLDFKPGVHVNYAETVLPMRDGLTKLRDFPKEFGGSGEVVSE